jgi:hypothetical protein
MSELSVFFDDKGASLGTVFYPKDFLVATLPSNQAALLAAGAMSKAGIDRESFKAISNSEMLEFFQEFKAQAGAGAGALRALSRFIDTEAKYADADIEKARQGYGFLVARSETEENTQRVAAVIAPFHPISVEWYCASGVQRL